MSEAQGLAHEAKQVKNWMSSVSPGDMQRLKESKLVQAGMPVEYAYQHAMNSRSAGQSLGDFLAKNAAAMPSKIAFMGSDSSSLSDQVGRSKERPKVSVAPDPKFRVKQAMIPSSPGPYQTSQRPQNRLAKAQRVGTPDDPNGTQFKPLHMVKPKKPEMPKVAFTQSSFGPTGGVWRPKYTSVVQPIGAAPVAIQDPNIKQGGNATPEQVKKASLFPESVFGATSMHGAYSGNGGNHASVIQPIGADLPIIQDPRLKQGGNATPKKAAIIKMSSVPLGPKGRLSSSRREGKPKMTGFAGPSIASVSKPIGFGKPLPGATKNRI